MIEAESRLGEALTQLSVPQRKAVAHGKGPLLVLSGAGSGKTRVLTYRAARLIDDGVDPRAVMVVTFTNRAAKEFRERLRRILGPEVAGRLWMSTLHSAGAKLLRTWGHLGGFDPKFTIYDAADVTKLIRRLLKELGWEKDRAPYSLLVNQIGDYKERLQTPGQVRRQIQDDPMAMQFDLDVLEVWELYERALEKNNAMDFADLIGHAIELLEREPQVRERTGIEYLLVDEYQDVNEAQHRLLNLLMSPEQNFCAVGDVDQAIYRFRGADYRLMLNFREHYPAATVIPLGQNYRSTGAIVQAAATVIAKNTKRIPHKIWTEKPRGELIQLVHVGNAELEAEHVAAEVRKLHRERGLRWRDMAVLYRTNYQSAEVEQAMLNQQVPYYVFGAKFFNRAEVRDVVRFLRFLANDQDNMALSDVFNHPPRWISEKTWEELEAYAEENAVNSFTALGRAEAIPGITAKARVALKNFHQVLVQLQKIAAETTMPELIDAILLRTGLKEWYLEKDTAADKKEGSSRADNLAKLVSMVNNTYPGQAAETLPQFLEFAALMSGEESAEADHDSVQLLTSHAAKGLEYRVIFMLGAEDGLYPHYRAKQDPELEEAFEEERRLFYVTMTRAEELLYIYQARYRASPGGQEQATRPSPYLLEVPAPLLEVRTIR
jgi:DNA helicase-2/ATP-dependent DNA helicase PcrA